MFDNEKYKNKPIKQTILDHRVIAGAGNIYACEALFRAGITPIKLLIHSLNKKENPLLLCSRSFRRGYKIWRY